jgi:hypothetical protein
MRYQLVRNMATCMLKEDIAEKTEGLGIYVEEILELRSRFRDQDAETLCHPSLQLISLLGPVAKCPKCGFSARFAKFVEDGKGVRHTKHPARSGSAADASFKNLGVLSLTRLTSWPEKVTPS